MKILVVDDSVVFRTQISSALNGVEGIEVVGTAANGRIAVQKLEQMSVDLMTLDMEMPELNGIETLKLLRAKGFKTKVIVFSSQTRKGAEKALEALSAGADDIVLKPSGDDLNFDTAQTMIKEALVPKVVQFMERSALLADRVMAHTPSSPTSTPLVSKPTKKSTSMFSPEAVVIASSTGGPTALEAIFSHLKGPYKKPLLIAQHMPPVFTQILAKRLSDLTGAPFMEAKDGDVLLPGSAYVAPGDYHLYVHKKNSQLVLSLTQEPPRNSVRPAADHLFESAAATFGKSLLGVVLTGMGEDGAAGAHVIRENGGRILIQDKESCVVFGMPGAIFKNDDFDEMGNLMMIAECLKKVLL